MFLLRLLVRLHYPHKRMYFLPRKSKTLPPSSSLTVYGADAAEWRASSEESFLAARLPSRAGGGLGACGPTQRGRRCGRPNWAANVAAAAPEGAVSSAGGLGGEGQRSAACATPDPPTRRDAAAPPRHGSPGRRSGAQPRHGGTAAEASHVRPATSARSLYVFKS